MPWCVEREGSKKAPFISSMQLDLLRQVSSILDNGYKILLSSFAGFIAQQMKLNALILLVCIENLFEMLLKSGWLIGYL